MSAADWAAPGSAAFAAVAATASWAIVMQARRERIEASMPMMGEEPIDVGRRDHTSAGLLASRGAGFRYFAGTTGALRRGVMLPSLETPAAALS